MIGNMSSQVPQPDDNHVEYYVEQNKKSNTLTDLQRKMIDQYQKWVKDKGKFGHGNGPMGSSYTPPTLNVFKNYGVKCSNCVFYDAANKACSIVTGEIEPDAICKFWVIPQNKIKGGEKNMSNDNLEKGVVPAVDATATTEPDGKGTMATAKGDFVPANAKQKATRRYAKKSLKKAARYIERAVQTMEGIPAISKADLPRVGRAGSVTVAQETMDSDAGANPNPTTKALPEVGRPDTPAKVDNTTNPYGVQLTTVRKAIKDLQKAEKKLVAVGRYAEIANTTKDIPAAVSVAKSDDAGVEKDVTDTIEGTVNSVIKADATCCDNACGDCKGPGCGCCADCKPGVEKADACPDCGKSMTLCNCAGMKKAEDTDDDADTEPDADEDDKEVKKSVWGGSFLPL